MMEGPRSPEGVILNVRGHSFRRKGQNDFQPQARLINGAAITGTLERVKRNPVDDPGMIRTGSLRVTSSGPQQWNNNNGVVYPTADRSNNVVNVTLPRSSARPHSINISNGLDYRDSIRQHSDDDILATDSEPTWYGSAAPSLSASLAHGDTRARPQSMYLTAQTARNTNSNDLGFQSDDNIWTSRLRSYQNSTQNNKYGRRPVGVAGVRVGGGGGRRQSSADGILEEEDERRGREELSDEDLLDRPTRYQQGFQLNPQMKHNKNYGSLPDCRPGGSILKKGGAQQQDGNFRHAGSMRVKKGSHRPQGRLRRVLFKNDVNVYRFDSEDSACSSSETEPLNSEPRRFNSRSRPAGAVVSSRQQGQASMGERNHSYEDLLGGDSGQAVRHQGRELNYQDNGDSLNRRAPAGSRRAFSVERTSSFGDNNYRRGINDYNNPSTNRQRVSERASTPGPNARRPDVRINSAYSSGTDGTRGQKPSVNAPDSNNNTGMNVGRYVSSRESQPMMGLDAVDSSNTRNGVEFRAPTRNLEDFKQNNSMINTNRMSLDSSMIDKISNIRIENNTSNYDPMPPKYSTLTRVPEPRNEQNYEQYRYSTLPSRSNISAGLGSEPGVEGPKILIGNAQRFVSSSNRAPVQQDTQPREIISISNTTTSDFSEAQSSISNETGPESNSRTMSDSIERILDSGIQSVQSTPSNQSNISVYENNNSISSHNNSFTSYNSNNTRYNISPSNNNSTNNNNTNNNSNNTTSYNNNNNNYTITSNSSRTTNNNNSVKNFPTDENRRYLNTTSAILPNTWHSSPKHQPENQSRAPPVEASTPPQSYKPSPSPQPSPGKSDVRFLFSEVSENGTRKLTIKAELENVELSSENIKVRSNKTGSVIHITIRSEEKDKSEVKVTDRRLTLPVTIDPYKIVASLDSQRVLNIEAPVVRE